MRDFVAIMPEIFIALTLAFVVIGEITYHGEELRVVSLTASIGLAAAFVQTLLAYQNEPAQIFGGSFSVDGLSLFFKLIFIGLSFLSIQLSGYSKEISPALRTEYCALILGACLAMCIAASASDLLLVFLSLELVNLVCGFIAGFGKKSVRSTEAAVKFMLFSVVAMGCLLYGFAILFGQTHSENIYEIHKALLATPMSAAPFSAAFALLFLSLSFQLASFPMYLWAPDVVDGAPTPISPFLSVAPQAAGFAVGLRLFVGVFAKAGVSAGQWDVLGDLNWPEVLTWVSGLTMFIGSLLAFRQTTAKRMVGCLVVSQSGLFLMGLLVLDQLGVAALLYNLVAEVFSVFGIFYVLSFFHNAIESDELSKLKGMLGRAVPESVCLILFLLCIAGVPPMPGFLGKFVLVGVALRHHRPILGAVGIISMTLSTAAIARLAYSLIGDFKSRTSSDASPLKGSLGQRVFLGCLIAPLGFLIFFGEQSLELAGKSLGFIFW